jgi:hypothetical protein
MIDKVIGYLRGLICNIPIQDSKQLELKILR